MQKKKVLLVVVVSLVLLLQGTVQAQRYGVMGGLFDARSYRVAFGIPFITPMFGNDEYMTLGTTHLTPTFHLHIENESTIDFDIASLHFISGLAITPWGYRQQTSPDSVYAFKTTTYGLSLGVGTTLHELLSSDGRFPLGFYAYGFARLGLFHKSSWNDQQVIPGFTQYDDDIPHFIYGGAFKTHFTFYDGPVVGLSAFYTLELSVNSNYPDMNAPNRSSLTNILGVAVIIHSYAGF